MKLKAVRIYNLDSDRNFNGVCEYIDIVLRNSLPQSASLTAPSSEGATPLYTKAVTSMCGFAPHQSLPLMREVAKIFDF